MALLHGEFEFTGPLGNISAYKRRGSDKIILRRKGGASRSRIKNDSSFLFGVSMRLGGLNNVEGSFWIVY